MYEEEKGAFNLGRFAAEFLITKCAIQPDFQLANLGHKDGSLVFVDSADVKVFDLPKSLTTDVVRQIKESIFSLVDNFESDFRFQSYIRAGFVSMAGLIGHIVYEDSRDNGYSSFLFLEKKLIALPHSLYRITKWDDVKAVIGEWLSLFGKATYTNDQDIKLPLNHFYKDNMFFIDDLMSAIVEDNTQKQVATLLQMTISAFSFGLPYTAYGLALKINNSICLEKERRLIDQVILQTQDVVEEYKDVLEKYLNLDVFELMWLLEDLDLTVPERR